MKTNTQPKHTPKPKKAARATTGQRPPLATTFHAHVQELRRRILWSALALGAGGAVGYWFRLAIVNFLQRPLHLPLYYNSPAGSFNYIMKVCLLVGVVAALPVMLYHLVRFIEPAFERRTSRWSLGSLLGVSLGLAVAGCGFAYYLVVPMSLHFFAGFNTPSIHPLIQANDYFNYLIKCLISFALIFQLPLLLLFIDFINPMNPRRMLHYERHVIVASLIVAVLLPFTYDPITQFVIALPIIVLYNLSILFVWLGGRQRRSRRAAAPTQTPARAEPQPVPAAAASAPAPSPAGRPTALMPISPYVLDLSSFRTNAQR